VGDKRMLCGRRARRSELRNWPDVYLPRYWPCSARSRWSDGLRLLPPVALVMSASRSR